MFQHGDGQLADKRLVGVGRAAVKIDHAVRVRGGRGARMLSDLFFPPAPEGITRPTGQRRARRDFEGLLRDPTREVHPQAEIDQRRDGRPQAAP